MPDIDIDFPWDERDDILDSIFKKYKLKRTAMVVIASVFATTFGC